MFIKVNDDKTSRSLVDNINRGNIIVLYYANWCGHCVSFKPEWHKLVKELKHYNDMRTFNIGEIEHSHLEKFPEKSVQAFPSIKLYKFNKNYNKYKQDNLATSHKTNKLKNIKNVKSLKRKKNMKKHSLTLKKKKTKDSKNNLFKNLFNSMNLIYNRNQIDNKNKIDDNNDNTNNENTNNKITNHNVVDYDFGKDRSVHKLLEFIRKHAEKDSIVNKYDNNNNFHTKNKKSKNKKLLNKKSPNKKVANKKSPNKKVANKKQSGDKVKKDRLSNKKQKNKKSSSDKIKKKMSKRYHKLKDKDTDIGNEILNSFNMPTMT